MKVKKVILMGLLNLTVVGFNLLSAQIRLPAYKQANITPRLEGWEARWISLPDEPVNVYGVYHFRKSFEMSEKPDKFIINVSADNRYKLYVNGHFVSLGPARCDVYNWNFETVDIGPYLTKGKNVLAAVVWNYAELKPTAQISLNETGFILQGNTANESIVNTDKTWLCTRNEAYSPYESPHIKNFYYVVGPGEKVNSAQYPWGWEQLNFDDSKWKNATTGLQGGTKTGKNYRGRLLVPRPIPPMEMTTQRIAAAVISQGINPPKEFPQKIVALTVPANSKVRLVLDNKYLTTGYLSLNYSKGNNSEITIGYSESYYDVNEKNKNIENKPKGDRDVVEGKMFFGNEDIVLPDGGTGRAFTTLWWRTWRYVELQIKTGNEPLIIDDIYGTFSAYPFERTYQFSTPEKPELSKMLEIGWRTARLCANEIYMDCPYYEQSQYFGDTRIQAMITLYNTSDPYMVKNAMEHGRQSIIADGLTWSRYPSSRRGFIAPFSLLWIEMGHDYYRYRGDEAYLKTLLPAYRSVLAWFEEYLKDDYSLKAIPQWFFVDWSAGFRNNGEPYRERDGNSAIQDLFYLNALESVAEMEHAFGLPAMGDHYSDIAKKIRNSFHQKYWDSKRGIFADTYDHSHYSQHTNSLAVLANLTDREKARDIMQRILADTTIAQATIYFRYYVNQALAKAGLGDKLLDNMQQWRDQLKLNLTTWAEQPEPSRSDCHAWSASPNIEFFRILLGIDSDGPGFKKIRIAPALGNLKDASGTMPHPYGSITVDYKIDKKGKLTASISIPDGTSGTFVWKEKEFDLKAGKQQLIVD